MTLSFYLSSQGGDSNYNILLPKNKMLTIIRKNRNITNFIPNSIKSHPYLEYECKRCNDQTIPDTKEKNSCNSVSQSLTDIRSTRELEKY